jgi:archaellum biogenesis ATPase FlaH
MSESHLLRITDIENIYIVYPRLQKILDVIDEIFELSGISSEPNCLFITGHSGVGKTRLIEHYLSNHPRVELADRTSVPVFSVEIPSQTSIKDLASTMLSAIGDPNPAVGTKVTMTNKLYKLLSSCYVKLIIIDEFQHLIHNASDKKFDDVANWLKGLINHTKIPIVLLGLPESEEILIRNSQLRRRFYYSMCIEPFNIRTVTGENEFLKFLSIIKDSSKFIFENDFFLERSFYLPLFFASNGTVANIMKFIKLVFRLAIKLDTNTIKKQYFALIYEQAIFKKESVFPNFQNPFNVDFDTFLSWSLVSSTIGEKKPFRETKRKPTYVPPI